MAGVATVDFDCKTATIEMKPEAKLTRATIEAALKGAGFGAADVTEAVRPKFTVVRATLRPQPPASGALPAATVAQLTTELPRELAAITELFVEPDGRATALLKFDASLDEAVFVEALRKRQVTAAAFARQRWPQSAAAYLVTLRKLDDDAARLRARAEIEKVNGVVAALDVVAGAAGASGTTFTVFTREPCANLETKLKEAFGTTGFALERIEPRPLKGQ